MIVLKKFYHYVGYGREIFTHFLRMSGRFLINFFPIFSRKVLVNRPLSVGQQFLCFPEIQPELSTDDCSLCEVCLRACPTNALQWGNNEQIILNLNSCIRCGICSEVCPHKIIGMNYIPSASIVDKLGRVKKL